MAYRHFGTGGATVMAFHGFGRSGGDFSVLEKALGEIATIHAFDLPFHGESPSPSERAITPFEPNELRDYFNAFADHINAEKLVLMGYSLGGRIALSLLETMPERISRAILIAPDGLHTKPWYRSLASSAWGRARYTHFIDHPGRVYWIVNALHSLKLMSDRIHRFLIGQTDTREKRLLLHDVWLSFRHIEPDLRQVAMNTSRLQLPIDLIFGAKDSVIKPELAMHLQPLAPQHISTTVVDAGHQLLTVDLGDLLRRVLCE